MVKAFSLQQNEQEQQRLFDEERRDLLARFGAATLELENSRTLMQALDGRRRTFLDGVAQRCGVREYRWIRIDGNNLVGDVYEAPAGPASVIPFDAGEDKPADTQVNGRG